MWRHVHSTCKRPIYLKCISLVRSVMQGAKKMDHTWQSDPSLCSGIRHHCQYSGAIAELTMLTENERNEMGSSAMEKWKQRLPSLRSTSVFSGSDPFGNASGFFGRLTDAVLPTVVH